MRCTNDIKSRINNEVKLTVDEITVKYSKAIETEQDKINLWRKNKLNNLREQIKPLVLAWAKELKKNSSSYIWEECSSSIELSEKCVEKMFKTTGWNTSFPTVSTKKLKNLKDQKEIFKTKVKSILTDTYIKVSFVKSLDELNDLIEQTKIQIKNLYAD